MPASAKAPAPLPSRESLEAWKKAWAQSKTWSQAEALFALHQVKTQPVSLTFGSGKYQTRWSGIEGVFEQYDTEDFEELAGKRDDMTDHHGTIDLASDDQMFRFELNDQIHGQDCRPIRVQLLKLQPR